MNLASATTRSPRGRLAEGCLHCGQEVASSDRGPFCCVGCAAVHALLGQEHLERYYRLRGPIGRPVSADRKHRDSKWLELLAQRLATARGTSRVELDVQGMHCSACVWLLEQLFQRVSAARAEGSTASGETTGAILVNPSMGRIVLTVGPSFPVTSFVERVEAFGYA